MMGFHSGHVRTVACANAASRVVALLKPYSPSLSIITPFTFFLYFVSWSATQRDTKNDASTPTDAAEFVRPAAATAMG